MKIKEIMKKAVAVEHEMSLKEASKIMSSKNIGSLVVVKDEKILGIITEKDIVDNSSSLERKLSSVMKRKVITIDENDNLENAAVIMTKNKIKRLPVIDEDGKLTGIITASDLVANSEDLDDEFLFG